MTTINTLAKIGQKAGKMTSKAPINIPVAYPVTLALDLVSAWKEYQNTAEQEQTARAAIAAERDVRIKSIKEQAKLLRDVIGKTCDERARNFDEYFHILNKSLEEKNDKGIDAALTLILAQTKISPMAQVTELIKNFNDPAVKEIEI